LSVAARIFSSYHTERNMARSRLHFFPLHVVQVPIVEAVGGEAAEEMRPRPQ
jgi:hypothetical protein